MGDTYDELARLGLAGSTAPILRDLVACAGAATCKLGLCRSRGAALAIAEHLEHGPLDLDALGELRIAISGCPNSCSRHSVADIGLFGAARRVDGRLVPHYQLRLGGRLGVGQARLATGSWIVPARRAPHFIEGLLRAYTAFGVEQGFQAFCVAAGPQAADALASSLGTVPGRSEDEAFHVDWGSCAPFSLAGRGPGECGAGVIDLVDVDLASSREALEAGRWLDAAVLAARALLVTRGEEPATSREALVQFERHFVETGLVGRPIGALLGRALQALQSSDRSSSAVLGSHDAETLLGTVSSLYESMDARLEFSPVTGTVPSASDEPLVQSDAFRDFRGVVCPLNWAKTRMVLTRLAPGQVLALLLDDEGARKVPESAGREGHAVMSVARQERDWLVHIRKAAKPAGGRV